MAESLPRLVPDTKSQTQESPRTQSRVNAEKHLCPSLWNYRTSKKKKTSRGKNTLPMGEQIEELLSISPKKPCKKRVELYVGSVERKTPPV